MLKTTPLPEPELGYEDQSIGGVWIEGYTADQLRAYGAAEYKRGIEASAKECDDCEYVGWKGEYMEYGPETDANEEIRRCAAAIRKLGETK